MSGPFPNMREVIPEGRSGNLFVDHFSIDEETALRENVRTVIGNPHFDVEKITPGDYCRLYTRLGHTLMTDTPMERKTNIEVVDKAKGNVLIGGLGLGMVLCAIYPKTEVERITIVEYSPDVIKLVMPNLLRYLNKQHPELKGQSRFRIARADVHKWKPPKGAMYDTIYMDIWNWPSVDAYLEMVKLAMRYKKYLKPGGWMGAWREMAAAYDYADYESLEEVTNKPPDPDWVVQMRKENEDAKEV